VPSARGAQASDVSLRGCTRLVGRSPGARLGLVAEAADLIATGDVLDRQIRTLGNWSLLNAQVAGGAQVGALGARRRFSGDLQRARSGAATARPAAGHGAVSGLVRQELQAGQARPAAVAAADAHQSEVRALHGTVAVRVH